MKVLITPRSFGKASEQAFEILKQGGFEACVNPYGRIMTEKEMEQSIAGMDALIAGVDPVTKAVIDASPKLKVISKYGVGLDNIDSAYAAQKGIAVKITAGANTEAVADYAFALLLAAARNVIPIDRECRKLNWAKTTSLGVYGKTLGVLGTGAIGRAVIRRAKGFDMRILAFDLVPDEGYACQNGVLYNGIDSICRDADFLSVHLPLTPETNGLISDAQFSVMKKTAVVINTARGGIVDEKALYEALKEKRIYGAGLDVFENEPPEGSPLLMLDNLVIGSHCAASNLDAVENMSLIAAKNVVESIYHS